MSPSVRVSYARGRWQVNIPTGLLSSRPNGYHFWKLECQRRQLNTCGQSESGWKIPVIRVGCLPTHLRPWRWGPRKGGVAPRAPGVLARAPTPTRTSESSPASSSVKLYFSYPRFGLIYIYTNIYINISTCTGILY